MSAQQALSLDGSSKIFDASTNRYTRREGISCLYIKCLDEVI
jgi:acyl transferase domain-containing protein